MSRLQEHDVRRMVTSASVGFNYWNFLWWMLGAIAFTVVLMLYIPGCIERDNEQFAREKAAMQRATPHTQTSDAVNAILNYQE